MLKKMKIKKFSFIKNLIFTILFGISSVCLLGAWTGNSDNINNYNSLFGYLYNTADIRIDLSFNDGYDSYTNWFETDVESEFGEIPYIDIQYDSVSESITDVLDSHMSINDVQDLVLKINMYNFNPSTIFSQSEWEEYARIILSGGDFESYSGDVVFGVRDNTGNYLNEYQMFDFSWNTCSYINYNGYSYEIDAYNEYDWRYNYTLEYVSVKFSDWSQFTNFDESGIGTFQFYINTSPIDYYLVDNMEFTLLSRYNTLLINYNTLQTNYNTLQSSYNTLQTNYTNLENDYSLLNTQYETLDNQYDDLQTLYNDLQSSYDSLQQEYEDYQELINNTMGTTSFDISQYSVSVGRVPNQPSFDYTKDRDINNNFSTIGYLNVSDIYSTYIYNNGQINNNNSIYITTPQSNLLTFDMTFNYTTQPNTMIKTTLTLPNGDLQQFAYSSTDFNYKGEWTLANLVASSSIGENYDINDISYKDVIITYENVGNNLSDIKLGSNNGYNTGFNSGYNTALDRINELSVELNEKTTNLQRVTEELTAKTIQYNNLYTRFQQLSDKPLQLNFQSLLWNIASTPFEVFKSMWNFDFLGFNIAQFVTR